MAKRSSAPLSTISPSAAQTVMRAAALLDLFTPERRRLGVVEAATLLHVPKTTAHRLLASMRASGYLRQTERGKYSPGAKVMLLARIYSLEQSIRDVARPYMQAMLDHINETVSLYVCEGNARYCIERLECSHPLRVIVNVGAALPLEVGAAGRLLSMSAAEARKHAFVISRGERVPDSCALAAPVFDASGSLAAALQITVPLARARDARIRSFTDIVVAAASELSSALGYAR